MIKTWDKRRLVVPLKHFITHPFQNWSMGSSHMMKPVSIYTDYQIDVPKVREKFESLVRESEDWDGEDPPSLQVISCSKEVVELRGLCSAKDPLTAWNLHCMLREELVRFVGELDNGNQLAKERVEIQQGPNGR